MLTTKKSESCYRQEKAKNGKKVKLATEIFNEYGDAIRTIIRSIVDDESKVDDIFQDFFLSIVHKPVPLSIRNLRGYLCRAVINDIRDATRRAQKYQIRIRKYAECRDYGEIVKQPQVIVAQAEEYRKMVQLIERQLSPCEAEAVILKYSHDENIRDAAEKMNVKKRTFSVYLSEGLRKIRRITCGDKQLSK